MHMAAGLAGCRVKKKKKRNGVPSGLNIYIVLVE